MKTALDYRRLFVEGDLSAQKIVQNTLSHIEEKDPQVGAFLEVLSKQAYAWAKELDEKKAKKEPLGPLAGVPIAIKDNIHIKGVRTSCASKFLTNYIAPFDATVIESLKHAGALLIGKTNLDEFAMGSSTENSAFQQTKNPWNLSCTPGGSSGGSAAAVAAGFAPLALGSDTGGSIRQPAALCAVVGFKPTYGRVSRYGLVAFGSSLDQIGPLGKTVEDVALTMNVIGHHCPKDATSMQKRAFDYLSYIRTGIRPKKIGVPWRFIENLAAPAKENFLSSIEVLKNLGSLIIDIDLDILKASVAVYYILATAEASTNLARFDGIRYGVRSSKAKTLDEVYEFSKEEGFGPEVKKRILLGTYVLSSSHLDSHYHKAEEVRSLMIHKLREAFELCEVIAMPLTTTTAFPLGSIQDPLQMYLQDLYTIGANLAGIPSISVPSGFDHDNKPWGLQLLGPQDSDEKVLALAYAFEQETLYFQKSPPLFAS